MPEPTTFLKSLQTTVADGYKYSTRHYGKLQSQSRKAKQNIFFENTKIRPENQTHDRELTYTSRITTPDRL